MTGRDEDRPAYHEREKKSFAELDRARRERSDAGNRPRSPGDQAKEKAATKQHLAQADALFGGKREEVEALVRAMHDARGSDGLGAACRATLDAVGAPTDLRDVSCFLDSGDVELVRVGLQQLLALHEAGDLPASSGLRTQLRMLSQDSDDEVAERAEELLERI